MCKHKWKETWFKGFPLEEINDALGSTKDIVSILEPQFDEERMMCEIMEEYSDDEMDHSDIIVDTWDMLMRVKKKPIWWEELFKMDIASRTSTDPEEQQEEDIFPPPSTSSSPNALQFIEEKLNGMLEGISMINNRNDELDIRMVSLELVVSDLLNTSGGEKDCQFGSYRTPGAAEVREEVVEEEEGDVAQFREEEEEITVAEVREEAEEREADEYIEVDEREREAEVGEETEMREVEREEEQKDDGEGEKEKKMMEKEMDRDERAIIVYGEDYEEAKEEEVNDGPSSAYKATKQKKRKMEPKKPNSGGVQRKSPRVQRETRPSKHVSTPYTDAKKTQRWKKL